MNRLKLALSVLLMAWVSLAGETPGTPKAHAFEKDILAFEAADKKSPPPQGAILFVGDSTFTKWKTIHEDLPGYTVINRGFGGSQMSDLLYFADRVVLPYKPRLIMVQEGGNDIHSGKSPEQLLAEIKAFVEKVHAALPGVPITIGSVTPNSARWSEFETRKHANKIIKEYVATDKLLSFIDYVDAFLNAEGKPRDELFLADKMHPNHDGYKVRVKVMQPFLGAPDKK